jgi:hypothetical protein
MGFLSIGFELAGDRRLGINSAPADDPWTFYYYCVTSSTVRVARLKRDSMGIVAGAGRVRR